MKYGDMVQTEDGKVGVYVEPRGGKHKVLVTDGGAPTFLFLDAVTPYSGTTPNILTVLKSGLDVLNPALARR